MTYSHLSNWLLLTALIALFPVARLDKKARAAPPVAALALLCIPLDGVTLNGYLYTLTAQLSITSLALLAAFSARRFFHFELIGARERRLLLFAIAALSPIYYSMALGLTQADPYSLGFPGNPAGYILMALSLLGLLFRLHSIALIMALAAIAPVIPIAESSNALDYLVDVWLASYAVIWTLIVFGRFFGQKTIK
jgi:hypothetical protein